MVEEGQEPKDMCALIGDKASYDSLLNGELDQYLNSRGLSKIVHIKRNF